MAPIVLGQLGPERCVRAVVGILAVRVDRLELRGEGHQHVVGRVVDGGLDGEAGGSGRGGGHWSPLFVPSLASRASSPPPDTAAALRTAVSGPPVIGRTGPRRTIPAMAIYLDHAATTPLRPEALDAMLPFLTEQFGNPSSAHAFGRKSRAALDEAHERVAARLHAEPREIIFTSGGTEANNLAIKGAAWAGKARGHRIVTSPVEHHAVGHTLRYLERFGFEIVEVPVDRYGRVDPDQLDAAITDKTILVTIMLANNEVGSVQPIAEIAKRVRAHKGVLHRGRCRAGRALRRPRRRRTRRRHAVDRGAQVRGPEGRRRALPPPRDAHPRPAAGRRAGAPPPRRDGERRRCSRAGRSLRVVVRRAPRDCQAAASLARAASEGRPRSRRHGADRPPKGPTAGPAVDHRPRHRWRIRGAVARPRGDRRVGRIRLHDRLDRGLPCPLGDGLPGGGGPRRTTPVARPVDDRPSDRRSEPRASSSG